MSRYSARPGPIGDDAALACRGPYFLEQKIVHETIHDLTEWYNTGLRIEQQYGRFVGAPELSPSAKLVLTHADLHLNNILLDRDGNVWLIDWGCSGYYPVWFEYITALHMAGNLDAPDSWRFLLPLMTGPYFAYESWLGEIGALSRGWGDYSVGMDVVWRRLRTWVGLELVEGECESCAGFARSDSDTQVQMCDVP